MVPQPPIYLDHAAATPLDPEVAAAIAAAQGAAFGNPSSQHAAGRAAKRLLEESRERILAALGGVTTGPTRNRLIFTSGASEANYLGIVGMAAAAGTGRIAFSRREHPSAIGAAQAAGGRGWQGEELPLDAHLGTARAAALAAIEERDRGRGIREPWIVCLTLICGQTGSLEQRDWLPDCRDRGILVHVDATQAAGWMPLDFHASAAATLALAPHKFGGPRGIGGLIVRDDVAVQAVQAGPQEQGLRGGTEAVPLVAGFARAVELAVADRAAAARVGAVRDRFEALLLAAAAAAGQPAQVIAAGGPRAPHLSAIAFPGLDRQSLAIAADLAGVAIATGTACASGSSEPAPALVAMGLPPEVVRGAVRFSFGRTTTVEEVDRAVKRLAPLLERRK
ncbi:MAG: Cysteine desulfurase [Planctomycetota bacterium]|jgi:cysteine desulfurase